MIRATVHFQVSSDPSAIITGSLSFYFPYVRVLLLHVIDLLPCSLQLQAKYVFFFEWQEVAIWV
jgi:hypothetical protein